MTTRCWARSAARPRSWVISSTAMPSWPVSISRWSRIWRWTVTSSALVGSSAMSRDGRAASPMAISARWRMPPENSWGYCFARRAASGRPASSSSSTTRLSAALPLATLFAVSDSLIWKPIFHSGLRFDIGSCGTMPISSPRSWRMRLPEALAMFSSWKTMLPSETRPFEASRPATAMAVVVLPEPDSPTIATVWPGYTVRFAPRTAGTSPPEVVKVMSRSFTSSSGRSGSHSWTAPEVPPRSHGPARGPPPPRRRRPRPGGRMGSAVFSSTGSPEVCGKLGS